MRALLAVLLLSGMFMGSALAQQAPPGSTAGKSHEGEPYREITAAQAEWLKKVVRSVNLRGEGFDDLRFLKPLLAGRRVVQIGNSRGGYAEYTAVGTRLVRYLHEELGFDVLVLEGDIGSCTASWIDADTLSTREMMTRCWPRVTAVEEMAPLLEYVRQSRSTPRPLVLMGNDNMQGGYFIEYLGRLARRTRYAREEALVNAAHLYNTVWVDHLDDRPYVDSVRTVVQREFRSFLYHLDSSSITGVQATPLDEVAWLKRVLWVRIESMAVRNFRNREVIEAVRDELMGLNAIWIATTLFPDSRIMTWADNGHLSEGFSDWSGHFKRAGEYLSDALGEQVYTIGAYAGGGPVRELNRNRAPAPLPGSLEERMLATGLACGFLDLSTQRVPLPETRWLFERVPSYQTLFHEQQIIPRDHYDGILFFREVHPPTKMRRD